MTATLLELCGVRAGYDGITVLRGVDLAVAAGQVVALLGPVLGVAAYLVSHRTTSALVQGDAVTIGLGAVTVTRLVTPSKLI